MWDVDGFWGYLDDIHPEVCSNGTDQWRCRIQPASCRKKSAPLHPSVIQVHLLVYPYPSSSILPILSVQSILFFPFPHRPSFSCEFFTSSQFEKIPIPRLRNSRRNAELSCQVAWWKAGRSIRKPQLGCGDPPQSWQWKLYDLRQWCSDLRENLQETSGNINVCVVFSITSGGYCNFPWNHSNGETNIYIYILRFR